MCYWTVNCINLFNAKIVSKAQLTKSNSNPPFYKFIYLSFAQIFELQLCIITVKLNMTWLGPIFKFESLSISPVAVEISGKKKTFQWLKQLFVARLSFFSYKFQVVQHVYPGKKLPHIFRPKTPGLSDFQYLNLTTAG